MRDLSQSTSKPKRSVSVEALRGLFLEETIKPLAFQRAFSIACWPHRSSLRSSGSKSLSISRKKSPAYMATARHHYADLPLVCQSRLSIMSEQYSSRNIMRQRNDLVFLQI